MQRVGTSGLRTLRPATRASLCAANNCRQAYPHSRLAASADWTGYSSAANGTNESGHVLAMGMGNPLEPGNYYIGVLNGNGSGYLNPMSYTLASRGIGVGFPIATNTLALN